MKTVKNTDIEKMTFETAYAALQANVDALETQELPLEEAMAVFEQGQHLARHCASLLENAELKVQQLTEMSEETLEVEE